MDMGKRMRWPLGPSTAVKVRMRLYSYMPAVLALLIQVAACPSPEAESYPTDVSTASKIARQFVQILQDALSTVTDSFGEFLRDTYWRAREDRLGIYDIAWCVALVCAIQGFILWKMTAAVSNIETKVNLGGESSDRPSSLWAAWKVNPEMGTYFCP